MSNRFSYASWRGRVRQRGRLIEAMIFLSVAKFLIFAVPMRLWRHSLGRIEKTQPRAASPALTEDAAQARAVATAVLRGVRLLPFGAACLPRAMAAQWMLVRRGRASRLMIGVGAGNHPLHAWVEAGGEGILGELPTAYRPNLTLTTHGL